MRRIKHLGFTIIEIMVVIVIFAILTGIACNSFADSRARHECEEAAGKIRDFLNEGNSQSAKMSQSIPLTISEAKGSDGSKLYKIAAAKTNNMNFWSESRTGLSISNIDSCKLLSYQSGKSIMTANLTLQNTNNDESLSQFIVLKGRKAPYLAANTEFITDSDVTYQSRLPIIQIQKGKYTALIVPKSGGSIDMYICKSPDTKYTTIK